MNFNYLYSLFPKIYHLEDAENNYQLKRYLESLFEGGVAVAKEDIENLEDLRNLDRCPDWVLPFHCLEKGIPYYPDIKPIYQRRILQNINILWKMKGSITPIEYLVRYLTGFDTTVEVDTEERTISVSVDAFDDNINIQNSLYVIERYLKFFIPIFFDLYAVISITVKVEIIFEGTFYEFPVFYDFTDRFGTEDKVPGIFFNQNGEVLSAYYEFPVYYGITDMFTTSTQYEEQVPKPTKIKVPTVNVANKVKFKRTGETSISDKEGI